MPVTRFIWGSGLSEHAWQTAESTGAAWVSNDAAAHISLLRATVAEELAVGMEQRGIDRTTMRRQVSAALEDWGLTHIADRDPMLLSTGQTRRVAIASALLTRPDSLVLDCPLDGLDTPATRHLAGVLKKFPGDVTVYGRIPSVLTDATPNHFHLQPDGQLLPERIPQVQLPPKPERAPGEPLLTASGVRVRDVGPFDFSVPAGQITHLSGDNGSGKTSLMLAALGLIPYSGTLRAGSMGWAPTAMDQSLIRRTVLSEVAVGSTEGRAAELLSRLGLEQWADEHPLDLPSSERRLVLIAAAMVREPEVLFIDEPTIGLDIHGQERLAAAMSDYVSSTEARAVLWTCHDEELADAISDHKVRIERPSA